MRRINRMRPFLRNERGVALPLALMALVVLGALSAALLAIGSSEVQIAGNHLRNTQALFLAEAGLEHAFNTLRTTPSLMTNANATLQNIVANSQLGGAGSPVGNYSASYQAAGANTVRVISTGNSVVGGSVKSTKVLRASMSAFFNSNNAIRTQGPLTITGNPTVQGGQCGSVHTNNNLTMTGNPSMSGAAAASGTYTVTGNPNVGPGSGGGVPSRAIPVINPTDFLNTAKASLPANQVFQMMANGQVRDGNNNLITTLSSGGSYNQWRYTAGSPAQWRITGNTGVNGVYYLQGNVSVTGNPGSPSTPWITTLIATGDIVITGNPRIQTNLTDTLFIAGLDISITGNPSQVFNGLMAAHEQFRLTGNPTLNGFLIAEDAGATSNTVIANAITGNPTITFNCNLNPPLQGPLQILSWGL